MLFTTYIRLTGKLMDDKLTRVHRQIVKLKGFSKRFQTLGIIHITHFYLTIYSISSYLNTVYVDRSSFLVKLSRISNISCSTALVILWK